MVYLTLCTLAFPAWQDLKRKEIDHSLLLMLWAVAAVYTAVGYVNGNWQGPGEIIRFGAAAGISFMVARFGKDTHIGRGDLLIAFWLFAVLQFDFYLKVICFGMALIWIWAIGCKITKKEGRLPFLPFLWCGYVLALFI